MILTLYFASVVGLRSKAPSECTICHRLMGTEQVFAPTELLWALSGLILTIAGNWLEAFITNAPWFWGQMGIHISSLGVNCQVGAVLLTGCMGGKNAAIVSQIAYLSLGLVFGLPVFNQGGGLTYMHEPSFGYLVGFVPAAWICGFLAFQAKPKLETLAFSSLCGLLIIHGVGLSYLVLAYSLGWSNSASLSLWEAILAYSMIRLPGHLTVTCAVSVIAFAMRRLMFY